ncbi:MAG TPA: mycofactocin-coupled SDR family oxidoreductase [Candidatus Sulfotelmatobacter sp.]|nr:mycofactocin-coupled SDR family oxidoreductase [Candidatus Sulfotelmatobacter sp.]
MSESEISATPALDRRNFLSGIGGMAAVTAVTPMLAGITESGAGQNRPRTAVSSTSLPNGRLQGKVAVVTGAARGIGRAVIIAFAREGADIVGLDICAPVDPRSGVEPSTPEDLEETGRLVRTTGRRWLGIKLDQRNLPALRAAGVRVEQEFGGIDMLFANAGTQSFHPLLEMEDVDWQITIDVNLTGTANAVRAFAPYIVKRGGGRIILTSSTQGQHGTKFGAAYSVSKWGIIGLMKSAALELGRYNITVNALIPGLINTPLTRHAERYAQVLETAGQSPKGLSTAEQEERARNILISRSPLGVPWIEPEDVAPVVVFLASDAARMVSGATYDVTGGDSANNTA